MVVGVFWGEEGEREVKDPTIMAQKLRGFAHYGKFKVQTSVVQFSFKKRSCWVLVLLANFKFF